MSRRIWYQRILCMALVVLSIYTGYVIYSYVDRTIPDKIHVLVNEEEKFQFAFPIEVEMISPSQEVVLSGASNIPADAVTIHMSDGFSLISSQTGTYTLQTKLFGIFRMKDIEVSVIDEIKLIPCGFPVGIYLETNGVLVVGTAKLTDIQGTVVEPAYAVLQSGDYIEKVNGVKISGKEDLIEAVKQSNGEELRLSIRRNEMESDVSVKPVRTQDGEYKLGIWVRDDAQGIGTLTYLTTSGEFGALGHGVSDVDTGELLEISEGKLYTAKILSIIKGTAGTPGGLSGVINYDDASLIGKIHTNSTQGIYGTSQILLQEMGQEGYMDIGLRQEVQLGTAYVRCELEGEIKDYEIQIIKLEDSPNLLNKGMEIRVTDPELLQKTNGIVQGMSGSPIIQNGKIIGAVTHVFVQDSTKGYGIFIENMLTNH